MTKNALMKRCQKIWAGPPPHSDKIQNNSSFVSGTLPSVPDMGNEKFSVKIDYDWWQRLQVFGCFQANSHNGNPNKMKEGQDAARGRNTWGVAWDSAPGVLGPRALAISITESNASIPRAPHYNITILHDFSKSNIPTELHFLELQIIQYSCPSVPLISKWTCEQCT